MPNEQDKGGQDPNDKADDEVLNANHTDDEIRESVINDYNFDPETQGELIDKLASERKESSKKLSTAIRQKKQYREKANAVKPVGEEPKEATKKSETVNDNSFSSDDVIFIANSGGKYDQEDIKELKELAKSRNISLEEASDLPIFKAFHKDKQIQKKNDEASLGASGGSRPSVQKSKVKAGMSREDHKKAWQESNEAES